jgi:hypothetical protein
MRKDATPGPNGFGPFFFNTSRRISKNDTPRCLKTSIKQEVDIRRLNYGVITLVPEAKDATIIRQYRPIYLLNVDYKGFAKF